jgi:hypothetical protein
MLYIDDEFVNVIAQQARVTYATQQLEAYHHALGRWQAYAICELAGADYSRVRYKLAYYRQQIARWQDYLGRLATEFNVAGSA